MEDRDNNSKIIRKVNLIEQAMLLLEKRKNTIENIVGNKNITTDDDYRHPHLSFWKKIHALRLIRKSGGTLSFIDKLIVYMSNFMMIFATVEIIALIAISGVFIYSISQSLFQDEGMVAGVIGVVVGLLICGLCVKVMAYVHGAITEGF